MGVFDRFRGEAAKQRSVEEIFEVLETNRGFISENFWKEIQTKRQMPLYDQHAYFSSVDVRKLSERISYFKNLVAIDAKLRSSPVAEFEVFSGDLLNSLDESSVHSALSSAISQHSSATGSFRKSALAAIATLNGQRMAAAYMIASSAKGGYQAGQHNRNIQRLFNDDVREVRFVQSRSNMNENQFRYTHYAWRLARFNVGNRSVARRALFSLVYNGGSCACFPKNNDEYGQAAPAEFLKRFGQNIWSQREAAAHLDEIKKSGKMASGLFSVDTVTFRFTTPEMGFSIYPG